MFLKLTGGSGLQEIDESRLESGVGSRESNTYMDLANTRPFPFLLLPTLWASRNRARRRERGDGVRAVRVRPDRRSA